MGWTEQDYLEITVDQARKQWLKILDDGISGKKAGPRMPIETLLTNAASVLVNYRKYGPTNRHLAPSPIPEFARVFRRTPAAFLAKMANLDGGLPNGARVDKVVGATLNTDSDRFATIYRVIFEAARSVGIGPDELPDFLDLEETGDLYLLGQDELTSSAIEDALEAELPTMLEEQAELNPEKRMTAQQTQRLFIGNARIGQHRFAKEVLHNCGSSCVFCGMTSPIGNPKTLLVASHIKPWSQSNNKERLDFKNGVAACPTHDKAFDTGLITVTQQLKVQLSPRLREHLEQDPAARAAFGSPPLRGVIDFDWREKRVGNAYLEWHREKVFQTD